MAWNADEDDSFDESFDEDPNEADMDDSADASFDETPLHDPAGPGLVTVIGMWLVLAAPLVFLLPMALAGLARRDMSVQDRAIAVGVVAYAALAGYFLWKFTQRYRRARRHAGFPRAGRRR